MPNCICKLFDCAPEQYPGGFDVTPMPADEVQDVIQDFGIEKVTDPKRPIDIIRELSNDAAWKERMEQMKEMERRDKEEEDKAMAEGKLNANYDTPENIERVAERLRNNPKIKEALELIGKMKDLAIHTAKAPERRHEEHPSIGELERRLMQDKGIDPKDPYEVKLHNGSTVKIDPSKGEGPEKIRGITADVLPCPEDLPDEDQKELIKSFEEGDIFPPDKCIPAEDVSLLDEVFASNRKMLTDLLNDRPIRLGGDVFRSERPIVGIDWGSEEEDKAVTMLRMPDGTLHQVPCGTDDCATCKSVRYWQQSQAAMDFSIKFAHILDLSTIYPTVSNDYYHLEVMPSPAGQTEIHLPRKVGPPPEVWVNDQPVGYTCGCGDTVIKLKAPIPEYGIVKIRWRS